MMSASTRRGVLNPVIPADSLAAAVLRAESAALSLRDLPTLREAARALVEAVSAIGCYQVVGASQAAESLVTAAALLSEGSVSSSDRLYSNSDKVVVVDAATVTGSAARACASYLRANGATWVGAVIYERVRPDLDGLDDDDEFDLVRALAC